MTKLNEKIIKKYVTSQNQDDECHVSFNCTVKGDKEDIKYFEENVRQEDGSYYLELWTQAETEDEIINEIANYCFEAWGVTLDKIKIIEAILLRFQDYDELNEKATADLKKNWSTAEVSFSEEKPDGFLFKTAYGDFWFQCETEDVVEVEEVIQEAKKAKLNPNAGNVELGVKMFNDATTIGATEDLQEEVIYGLYMNKEEKPLMVGSKKECEEKRKHLQEVSPEDSYHRPNKYVVRLIGNTSWESLEEAKEDKEDIPETHEGQMDFLAKDEDEAIKGYKEVIKMTKNKHLAKQLNHIEDEEVAHKEFLELAKENPDATYEHKDEKLSEKLFTPEEQEEYGVDEEGYYEDHGRWGRLVQCGWCEDLCDQDECRYEVNFGWLCDRCQSALWSHGEKLHFIEPGPDSEEEEVELKKNFGIKENKNLKESQEDYWVISDGQNPKRSTVYASIDDLDSFIAQLEQAKKSAPGYWELLHFVTGKATKVWSTEEGRIVESKKLTENVSEEEIKKVIAKIGNKDLGKTLSDLQDTAFDLLDDKVLKKYSKAAQRDLDDCEGTDALYINGEAFDWKEFESRKVDIVKAWLRYFNDADASMLVRAYLIEESLEKAVK